ncbi:MAG TPA: FAD-dependent oxidoreductase [Solirubrobacterales bacterium]|nr:FAD-dependent oxidoreductase [Solirubrobacterales bacterium]
MENRQDAIVVGSGIIGAAIAFELAKRGYRTLNLDRLPAAGYGPTSNSCAIVRAYYSSWEGVAMAHESFGYWEDWEGYLGVADDFGTARYRRCGSLLLKSAGKHHEKAVAHYDRLGVPYEDWDAAEVRRRHPYLDLGEFWPPRRPEEPGFHEPPSGELPGAIFNPGAGYVDDPQLATHNLQRAAEAAGGRFEFRAEVTAIEVEGERVAGVTLADGRRLEAPVVVNVAGPHSDHVNRLAGVAAEMRIRTRALRHEVHYVPAPAGVDFEGAGCVLSDGDQGIYIRPTTANHILVGSEDPECDPRVWVEDPGDYDRTVSEEQWNAQVFRLAKRIPSLRIPNARKGVVDLYDVSDDWMPIYDRSGLDGFYMAVGTSGNQFKNAPVAGLLMAELIDRVENGHDHDADPVRIGCRYTGVELDAGFYSRLREVNAASSFSVRG